MIFCHFLDTIMFIKIHRNILKNGVNCFLASSKNDFLELLTSEMEVDMCLIHSHCVPAPTTIKRKFKISLFIF